MRRYVLLTLVLGAVVLVAAVTVARTRSVSANPFSGRTLDGSGDNATHPTWGEAGTQFPRVAAANYVGNGQMVTGPSPRYISNRTFTGGGKTLFPKNDASEGGGAWGQFTDHDRDLRNETAAEAANMPYDKHDKLEGFSNDVGSIAFSRPPAAPGTGTTSPRQQINTISSFIDGSQVYGVSSSRLDWLRDGTAPNNGAPLMPPEGHLPRAPARDDAATAPPMDLMGQLVGAPTTAVEAGDVRANENVALTAIQTLFAREHNRIVGL